MANEVYEKAERLDPSLPASNVNPIVNKTYVGDAPLSDQNPLPTTGSGGSTGAYREVFANTTITAADDKVTLMGGGAATFVLDPLATFTLGHTLILKNSVANTGVLTIQADGVETIDGLNTQTVNIGDALEIQAGSTEWEIV